MQKLVYWQLHTTLHLPYSFHLQISLRWFDGIMYNLSHITCLVLEGKIRVNFIILLFLSIFLTTNTIPGDKYKLMLKYLLAYIRKTHFSATKVYCCLPANNLTTINWRIQHKIVKVIMPQNTSLFSTTWRTMWILERSESPVLGGQQTCVVIDSV